MSLTFHELVRAALTDLAGQAKPTDLAPAALADAARRSRILLGAAVGTVALTVAAGTLAGYLAYRPDKTGSAGTARPSMESEQRGRDPHCVTASVSPDPARGGCHRKPGLAGSAAAPSPATTRPSRVPAATPGGPSTPAPQPSPSPTRRWPSYSPPYPYPTPPY